MHVRGQSDDGELAHSCLHVRAILPLFVLNTAPHLLIAHRPQFSAPVVTVVSAPASPTAGYCEQSAAQCLSTALVYCSAFWVWSASAEQIARKCKTILQTVTRNVLSKWRVTFAQGINIRAAPDTSGQLLGKLNCNEVIEAYERQVRVRMRSRAFSARTLAGRLDSAFAWWLVSGRLAGPDDDGCTRRHNCAG